MTRPKTQCSSGRKKFQISGQAADHHGPSEVDLEIEGLKNQSKDLLASGQKNADEILKDIQA
jgi:hypothetical protein